RDEAVGGGAGLTLTHVLSALDPEDVDGLVEVTPGLLEGLLAVHHAGGGQLAKPLHVGHAHRSHCPDSRCESPSAVVVRVVRRPPGGRATRRVGFAVPYGPADGPPTSGLRLLPGALAALGLLLTALGGLLLRRLGLLPGALEKLTLPLGERLALGDPRRLLLT